ncbi:MAG: hypothetical protein AB9869_13995 [Verrucomicrobiia bacterium]
MQWAILSRHYINAWSVASILGDLGWRGRVVALKERGEGPVLMELFGRDCEVWETSLESPDDLVEHLARRIPVEDAKVFFFMDERFIRACLDRVDHPWMRNARVLPGAKCCLEQIADKFQFYRFIESRGLGSVPRTIPSDHDPVRELGESFFLRFRRSWAGTQRLPTIRLIESRTGLDKAVEELRARGYREDSWCYQEQLSLDPRDNVSVCGWHDKRRPVYLATHKVMQFPARQGNGDVVEIVELTEALEKTTRRVLDALDFEGPFELEFVRDCASSQLKLIELNPRFWMQHALCGATTGQAVIRRYLGWEDAKDHCTPAPKYWINTVVALNRLLRGNFSILRYLVSAESIKVPPWRVALRWVSKSSPRLIRRFLPS